MKETYYDVLGVSRGASPAEMNRAHGRLKREFLKDTVAPDPKREALLDEALAVLSDPKRRGEYDASLIVKKAAYGGKLIGTAALIVAVIGAGAFYWSTLPPAPKVKERTTQEILNAAQASVGRVQSIEISGRITTSNFAFAIEDGVMATPCEGLTPGAQLQVDVGHRAVPARMAPENDATGLCKLAVDRAGSWPFVLSVAPKTGEKIYIINFAPSGDMVLAEGSVRRVLEDPKGRVIEISIPVRPGASGSPLLDAWGRVVGVSTGEGRHVALPAAWLYSKPPATASAPASASPAAPAAAEQSPAAGGAAEPGATAAGEPSPIRGPVQISPERQKKLEEAFRPPPSVPKDL